MHDYESGRSKPYKTDLSFYSIIRGGIKAKLLESIINTKLLELFSEDNQVAETHIVTNLGLHPLRAKKWLHLLCSLDFLIKEEAQSDTHYKLSLEMQNLSRNIYICESLINQLQMVGKEDLSLVLKGYPVSCDENWPPASFEESARYEEWLSKTSSAPIHALLNLLDFNRFTHILDVGSGDGTVACALAKRHSNVKFTLFNLPFASNLIQSKILKYNLQNQIKICEGDFIKDMAFPLDHNCILFCRVLWDWSKSVNLKLLKMAYDALPNDGVVVICELFREFGYDKVLPYEYLYIYWDAYETDLFKTTDEYVQLLKEVGFKDVKHQSHHENIYFSILIAQK